MAAGSWWVNTYGEVTGFILYVHKLMSVFIDTINIKIPIRIGGGIEFNIPIFSLVLSAIFITMVASVFVKGAKG